MFGIGKGAALKSFRCDQVLVTLARVFLDESSEEEITSCGEKLIVGLYGGELKDGLNTCILRFRKFTRKVMTSSTYVQV